MHRAARLPLLLALACLAACSQTLDITPANARKITVCVSEKKDVKQMFGEPNAVGLVGGMTIWTFVDDDETRRLMVAFAGGRAVDVALVPKESAALVELKNRCR